ncbi:MAG: alpha-mannosidase [Candidatus Sumerlaeia bacterium]|nr:alpha-mannosidase [Candidatus Sumerlaeia bacterium]
MLTHPKTLRKIKAIETRYMDLRYEELAEVPAEIHETMEHHRSVPEGVQWKASPKGTKWGCNWGTAWFRGTFKVPGDLDGEALFLRAKVGLEKPDEQQALLFVDGVPNGVFDFMHFFVRLTGNARAGKVINIALEAYASHSFPNVFPDHEWSIIEENSREFTGLYVCRERRDVTAFLYDLKTLWELQDVLDVDSLRRNKVARCLEEVFAVVYAKPIEAGEENWRPALKKAREIMRPHLELKNSPTAPVMGFVGHSHLDTAWLWPIAETHRKAARTFSSVLNLMEQYPEGIFTQSAPYHMECIRQQYPAIFEKVKQRVAEGKWEPNGAAWIEPDCNIPSGESLVRQLFYGQKFTREHFGYTADTLWQPDVFGYSAALPQILLSAGVRFFCTTKISWNDTTRVPYDTFMCQGIDGSSMLATFNTIHAEPTPDWLVKSWKKEVQHKDVQHRHLAAYGWGDGGGGPTEAMFEMARRTADLEGCPKVEHTSVSDFMQTLEAESTALPTWVGELYLELHRGTLTSIAPIKKGNRHMEEALRDAELLHVLASQGDHVYPGEVLDEIWKEFLVLQFHDILPGTSIQRVNEEAMESFSDLLKRTADVTDAALGKLAAIDNSGTTITLLNTSEWDRSRDIYIDLKTEISGLESAANTQIVERVTGEKRLLLDGVVVPAFGKLELPVGVGKKSESPSPFKLKDRQLETPLYRVKFDKAGRISSLCSKDSNREWVTPGGLMNNLLMGEDVPEIWDNWDIDIDQDLKLAPQERVESEEVVADGPIQFRIRRVYSIGKESRIVQDTIFHAGNPRIDFETRVEWKEKYQHLKAAFGINIHASVARHEIQFGHVERPTHRNLPQDRARFEVCNHRWTDLSDDGAGVAILNDCKYGIATRGNELRLSLIKSGRHPDPRGDEGTHDFTYSILPHEEPFSVPAVVRPAIELNRPVKVIHGKTGNQEGRTPPFNLDSNHVILDTIKGADDGRGYILRLYEAGRRSGVAVLQFSTAPTSIVECTVLEEDGRELKREGHSIALDFRPFQVRTIRVIP